MRHALAVLPSLLLLAATPVAAAPDAAAIRDATFDGAALPDGQSALTVKLQVLLDRAGISPGIIDGYKGGMSESAIRAFESREGLAVDGVLDQQVWAALGGADAAVLQENTITEEDTRNLSDSLPSDYGKMAELDWLGFTSVAEKLAERFHMDQDFLRALNPGAGFAPGETLVVAAPGDRAEGEVARITIDKSTSRLIARDKDDKVLVNYPVTVGSAQTPSPSGTHEVVAIAIEPTYSYLPDTNFQQGDNDEPLTIPPGPNGPVGLVWIDLSEPTYGLHGTPEPAQLFTQQSHGCVRMTNWDAEELAHMVSQGVTVEFAE